MPTLDFKGKQFIYAHHLTVPFRTLEIDKDKSHTIENSPSLDDNLIIHGDNLHALKALLPKYAGKIKCIYIDPPYNTGNENWVYNDNVNSPMMKAWLEKNSPIDVEDLERHDKWLCMMWPRLHLLRELLSDDGIIFISIDDNEQHHLRMLMDEIFDEKGFFARIAWESRTKPTNMGGARFNIQTNTELIIVYGKKSMTDHSGFHLYPTAEKKYPYKDEQGKYRLEEFQQRRNIGSLRRDTMLYEINGIKPKEGYRWQVAPDRYRELQESGSIVIEGKRVYEKIYKSEEDSFAYEPFWGFISKEIGTSESGKSELNEILGIDHGLETVKPTDLVRKLIFHSTTQNDIILDSFAGSGTTAHAVLALNKEDGGNRKFILIECEDYADTITAERVRRVIKGVENAKDENLQKGLGGSFTYCTLGETIDTEGMLTGDSLPTYQTLANYVAYAATGSKLEIKAKQENYCFGETKGIRFYLIYEPTLKFLESNQSALDAKRAEQIAAECKAAGKKAYVYASHKFMSQKELTPMGITFCQLPYSIYQIA